LNHLKQTLNLIAAQKAAARNAGQRRLVVLSGERSWSTPILNHLLHEQSDLQRPVWISECAEPGTPKIDHQQAKQLLGQETDLLVYDAWSGFEPNVVAAAAGTLVGGGLLLLLVPSLDSWASYADPDYQRLLAFPFTIEQIEGRFLSHVVQSLKRAQHALILEQGRPLPVLSGEHLESQRPIASRVASDDHCLTIDQSLAVAAIVRVATGHAKRPLVITSDRGRGKSSALGIACAQLMAGGSKTLLVTASRIDAVRPVFEHAKKVLGEQAVTSGKGGSRITFAGSSLQFVAADALRGHQFSADLLLVDEAASLPAVFLEDFLGSYNRIVYVTTVHGYEGSGRSFDLRFKSTLNQQRPQWKALNLQQPIRWQPNDPVENWLFDAMLLNAAAADSALVIGCKAGHCRFEKIDRNELLQNQSALAQLFGLLVTAHYQTTPNDLRALLDAPNIVVWVARFNGEVVAAALVSVEGGFNGEIADAIWRGERRPRGHLLPQTLSAHEGLQSAAGLFYQRIMRIAVHPSAQRKRLGSCLIEAIRENARSEQCDFLGSSFAATADVVAFWKSVRGVPVRLGVRRDTSSGCYSAIVLDALSDNAENLLRIASQRFNQHFTWHLSRRYNQLDTKLAVELLTGSVTEPPHLAYQDWLDVEAFSEGYRQYDGCCHSLWLAVRLALSKNLGVGLLHEQQLGMLVMKVLQGMEDSVVIDRLGYTGKKQLESELRVAMKLLHSELRNEEIL